MDTRSRRDQAQETPEPLSKGSSSEPIGFRKSNTYAESGGAYQASSPPQ